MGTMVYDVNSTATQILAAKQVKENIFMELLHRNNKGVNQVEEVNASTVRMFKAKQITDSARTIGAATNGGFFNNGNIGATQVEEYDLNLLHVYDQAIDIPEVQQDMCPVDIFDNATKNLGGRVATEINASTIAYQLAEKYNKAKERFEVTIGNDGTAASANDTFTVAGVAYTVLAGKTTPAEIAAGVAAGDFSSTNYKVEGVDGAVVTFIGNALTVAAPTVAKSSTHGTIIVAASWNTEAIVLDSTPDYYASYLAASSLLDDGDEANGIQSFPFEEREFLMGSDFRRGLMSAKGVLLGGSNFAQSMLAKGAVSPEDKKEFGSMYIGEIDLVPCYLVPTPIWKRANTWAGGATKFAGVNAILCAASATDRGIATQDYVKVIDSPAGPGKRLQPKTRWGINVSYAKGIVPILAYGTAAPTTAVAVVAPGSAS